MIGLGGRQGGVMGMGLGAVVLLGVLTCGSLWADSTVRHCVDAKGRIILRSDHCGPGEKDRDPPPPDEIIPLLPKGTRGQYWVAAVVNNRVTVEFLIDTGANVVVLPGDVTDKLAAQGSIRPEDWLGMAVSTMADGSSGRHAVARLESLRIGERELKNVAVTVTPAKGMPLLGTSVLEQLGAWRIDPEKRQLLIPRLPGAPTPRVSEPPPSIPAVNPKLSGNGKTLRQCWRSDGSSYLSAPPCPVGSGTVPVIDRNNR
ncbi:MAG: retroviral-like aspartic protease family protein [Magnetococcales bacterium]|nr:retroviral-like aspartic protease family protein [Magnetococcales bacterium]